MTTLDDNTFSAMFALRDTDATEAFARILARTAPSPAVVFLHGDLGAGKSTLARAWLRALGVRGAIRSPTYTLVERYPLTRSESNRAEGDRERTYGESTDVLLEALHLDLYRIGSAGELEFLGLDDVRSALWLVEWPERGEGALPQADLRIRLALSGDGDEGRAYGLSADTAVGQAWLERILKSVADIGLRPLSEARP